MSEVINITIRILPSGEELDVELPVFSTGKEIIEELLDAGINIPRNDQEGNPINYKLTSKAAGVEVSQHKSLYDISVANGDTLLMVPVMIAGEI